MHDATRTTFSTRPSILRGPLVAALALTVLSGAVASAEVAPEGADFQVNTNGTSYPFYPSAAVADDGSFVVVWEGYYMDGDGYAIGARFFDSAGVASGPELVVNTTTTYDQLDADVAALADGSFVVVWDSGPYNSLRDVFGQRLDSAGQKLGDEFQINEDFFGDDNDPVVAAAADGGFLVVWEIDPAFPAYEDLWARRFDSSGQPVGGQFLVNSFTTGDQEDADIASDDTGNFVVVWESDAQDGSYDSVVARRLDSTGQPIGDEFVVNDNTVGIQQNPSLAVRADGTFVVVWEQEYSFFTFDDSVQLRFFDPDGTPRTSDVQMETNPGVQFSPSVGFNSLGQATAVWDGEEMFDPFTPDVWYRNFDDTGVASQPEALLSTETTDLQFLPVVAFGSSGRGVAAWPSDHTGALQLFARTFPSVIFCDGFESGDTDAWSSVSP